MNLTKLKIETHNTNLKNKLNYTKTQTYSNLKNIKLVRNLFKLKLEDRKRIKGINFSTHKKEKNNYTLYKLKRKEEATMLQYDEANFQKVLNKYNKLKHEIFIKEQKEKRQKTQETLMKEKLNEIGIEGVDGILYDLGVSSFQLDIPERGFSYNFDAKLDMRMDQTKDFSAYDIVNKYKEEDISKIIFDYGEEKYARSIAGNIINKRK